MNNKQVIRVTEFLYVLRMFIAAAKKLKSDDMRVLEEIIDMMKRGESDK